MKRILLLNPPGSELFVRDYYCSKVSKGSYLYHPTDLLILYGYLLPHFELKVLDCIVQRKPRPESLEEAVSFYPDAVIFLTGSVSKKEDYPFLAELKERTGALMLGTGDCLLEEFETINREAPWLDAIILDFFCDDTLRYLQAKLFGEDTGETPAVKDLATNVRESISRVKGGQVDIPVPRYELFPNEKYSYPFVRGRPFASVLTDYGCPYRCKFCVMTSLGFKHRSVENVMQELDYVWRLGMRDLYFVDQTFGYNRKRLIAICEAMIERKYNFRWVAFTRVDRIDDKSLALMKRAGCHTLMFGIESPIQRVLDEQKKDLKVAQIECGFALCKKHGIRTLGTFIIGLPGTSYEENLQILNFAIKLDLSYASFNVLIPRMGTETRQQAKESEWILDEEGTMDQSGTFASMESDMLSAEEILDLRKHITRSFYFRPRYLAKRLFELRSFYELQSSFANALGIFEQLLPKQLLENRHG